MTIEGANNFFDATDYAIYTTNSETAGQYCVVLPKNNNGTYNMLVDLHMKSAFDSLSNGSKTKEQLIEEIKQEYNGVKTKYSDGILVMPMLNENLYTTAIVNNDKQKLAEKVKKIGAITSEIYKKLTDSGIDKQKIDQKIIMIIKNNEDIKFVEWLKEQMPDFVIGVNSSELQAVNTVNPFMENSNPFMPNTPTPAANDNIFGPATATTSSSNDIFNAQPVTTVAEPTVINQTPANDIFASPAPAANESVNNAPFQSAPAVQQPVVEQSAPTQPTVENANVFGTPTAPANNVTVEQVTPEPSPVQSTPLEATTTITPVQSTETAAAPTENGENIPATQGSKGFINLLILLVVLVGVTFISIELGKFLYNTYGV